MNLNGLSTHKTPVSLDLRFVCLRQHNGKRSDISQNMNSPTEVFPKVAAVKRCLSSHFQPMWPILKSVIIDHAQACQETPYSSVPGIHAGTGAHPSQHPFIRGARGELWRKTIRRQGSSARWEATRTGQCFDFWMHK